MTGADPARVLRRAVLGWGLGHLALGRTSAGVALLVAEVAGLALVAWLTIGLADTSLYLAPFLAGIALIVAWAWQAVAAYRAAKVARPASSPPLAMAWLAIPLLAWGAGFWLVAARSATPAAVLDRFVTEWNAGRFQPDDWPPEVIARAREASEDLRADADGLRNLRLRIEDDGAGRATAVAEIIHFERRDTRFLWLVPGTDLMPVADRRLLTIALAAEAAELPGGGDVGAVRWRIVQATRH